LALNKEPHVSIWRYIIFISIMLSVLSLGHYYIWRRLIRDSQLPKPWSRSATGVFIAVLLIVPITMSLLRNVPRETLGPIAFATFVWVGLLSTFFWVLVGGDLVRFVAQKFPRSDTSSAPESPEKRVTLNRLFAGGVALTSTTIGGVAIGKAMEGFSIVEKEITLDKLPPAFDGFRIAQLSDVHVGPTIGRDFVEKMVRATNSLRADLIAITGDLVDGSVANLRRHTEPLGDLEARHGTYFVTGNHEYYSGADEWIDEMQRLGIPTLRNDSVRLQLGADSLLLAGVTDHSAEQFGDAPDLERALRERKPHEEVVLLAHQPREVREAEKHDVGLQLSGHTHGGQFWPWNWVVHLVQPVVAGLAKFGRTQIYVNTGTGYWGPPMRLGTESEISLIVLRSSTRA
jgi:uncharacterized protein